MAEHDIIVNSDDFPSNVKKDSSEKEKTKPQKREKIVTGDVKKSKPSFLKKAAGAIFSDVEEEDLRSQVIFDYLVPTIKDTVVDIGKMLLESIFYGTTSTKRRSAGNGTAKPVRVSYSSYYDKDTRSSSKSKSTSYDFGEITMDSRGDAEKVLDTMLDIAHEYNGEASVGDFLDLVGVDNNFTDYKYGWTTSDLIKATISRNHNGYVINFPKPTHLD